MIRNFKIDDISIIMQIWCDKNIQSHDFIAKEYGLDHYQMVEEMLPHEKVYVYEDDRTQRIEGFIGLTDYYIAGISVRNDV